MDIMFIRQPVQEQVFLLLSLVPSQCRVVAAMMKEGIRRPLTIDYECLTCIDSFCSKCWYRNNLILF